MIEVKEFWEESWLDRRVNKWLKENPEIQFIDIKYSCVSESGSGCLIIFKR